MRQAGTAPSLSGFICYLAKISFSHHMIPNVASKHSPLVLVFIFSVDDVTTLATNDTCLKLFSRGKTTRLADMAKRPKDPTNNQKSECNTAKKNLRLAVNEEYVHRCRAITISIWDQYTSSPQWCWWSVVTQQAGICTTRSSRVSFKQRFLNAARRLVGLTGIVGWF